MKSAVERRNHSNEVITKLGIECFPDLPVIEESKDVKLVLSMQMDGNNNVIFTNTAEIAEDYNKQGVTDVDSIPGNKELKEDDISTAEIAIGVKTGETLIYFSLIIAIILTGIAAVLVINNNKSKLQLKKKGV